MTDIETAILYIEHLSDEEWQKLKTTVSSCSETRYCLDSCHQKCSVVDLLQAFHREESREETVMYLRGLIGDKVDELGSKPIYCLEQGYCALYCISSCQYGKFMRTMTRERALEYDSL